MTKTNRYIYLDILKILACLLVIFSHTGSSGFFHFSTYPIGSIKFFLYMIPTIFSKFCVPMFFMISGALLLDKEEDIKTTYTKRLLRFVIIMFIWMLLKYSIVYIDEKITFFWFVKDIYSNVWWNGMHWFLYMYLAFLIILPLLKIIAQNLKDEHFYLIICICVFFNTIFPIIKCITDLDVNSSFNLSGICIINVFYPIIGYYIHKNFNSINNKSVLILWIINIFAIILNSMIFYYYCNKISLCDESSSQLLLECFTYLNCITLFVTAKKLFGNMKLNNIIYKIVILLSSCTLGIYLLHITFDFYNLISNILVCLNIIANIVPLTICVLKCIIIFVICFCITCIIRKIPILKNLV